MGVGCARVLRLGEAGSGAVGAGAEDGGCEDAPAVSDGFGGLAVAAEDALAALPGPALTGSWVGVPGSPAGA